MEYMEKIASEESLGGSVCVSLRWAVLAGRGRACGGGLGGDFVGISNLRGVGGTRTRVGASMTGRQRRESKERLWYLDESDTSLTRPKKYKIVRPSMINIIATMAQTLSLAPHPPVHLILELKRPEAITGGRCSLTRHCRLAPLFISQLTCLRLFCVWLLACQRML